MTTANEVMTPNPVTCKDNQSIRDIVDVMSRENTGIVPILDSDDQLCGLVTDRDICLEVVLKSLDPQRTKVSNIMQHNLVTCLQDDDIKQVIEKMKKAQVKRILVTQEKRCVGLISEADIAQQVGSNMVGDLAQGIYR